MDNWIKTSLLLCLFGFMHEFRPSEIYNFEYLSGHWRNITADQVNRDVYPISTYSFLSLIVISFLIIDILRYKPILIVSAICGIIIWSFQLWTLSLLNLQISQVFYGTFLATQVAYYTYIYAKVAKERYQQVTGHTRAAILSGKFLSGVLAQVLISANLMDFYELIYITFGGQCLSLIVAICLPAAKTSVYFYTAKESQKDADIEISTITNGVHSIDKNASTDSVVSVSQDDHKEVVFSWHRAIALLWHHFKSSYSNKVIIQWSFWWAIATGGAYQVDYYIQLMWLQIEDGEDKQLYNGAIIATLTLLSALASLAVGESKSQIFERWNFVIVASFSFLQGALLLVIASTSYLWLSYCMYILFGVMYYTLITLASSIVARQISNDSFALIFGFNTFLALIVQSMLTVVVISDAGFKLDYRGQYTVYGSMYLVLGVFCLLITIYNELGRRSKNKK